MKKLNNKIFQQILPTTLALCYVFMFSEQTMAAPRVAIRGTGTSVAKQTAIAATTQPVQTAPVVETPVVENTVTEEPSIRVNLDYLNNISVSSQTLSATSSDNLSEQIKKQREAFAAREARDSAEKSLLYTNNSNKCDSGLRKCMKEKCGNDFTKCATDGDTIFGDKINSCKRDLKCSGEEIRLFTTEIKADRDMNVRLASYNKVIECGNAYTKCMVSACAADKDDETYADFYQQSDDMGGMNGKDNMFTKCLSKSAENGAIQQCKTIADKCKEQDSGLPGRFSTVLGKLRETAETDIKKDESRMYELRDLMRKACTKLGTAFDERTFDCIYTVNFYAGDDAKTPKASRKRYAGDPFVCNQEWFGIDVTTYKENAYRETRSQKGATAAMLGSGVGLATSMITSGAISRGLETQKAEKALVEECTKNNGFFENNKCNKEGDDCAQNHGTGKYQRSGDKLVCTLDKCEGNGERKLNNDKTKCVSQKD